MKRQRHTPYRTPQAPSACSPAGSQRAGHRTRPARSVSPRQPMTTNRPASRPAHPRPAAPRPPGSPIWRAQHRERLRAAASVPPPCCLLHHHHHHHRHRLHLLLLRRRRSRSRPLLHLSNPTTTTTNNTTTNTNTTNTNTNTNNNRAARTPRTQRCHPTESRGKRWRARLGSRLPCAARASHTSSRRSGRATAPPPPCPPARVLEVRKQRQCLSHEGGGTNAKAKAVS